MRVLDRSFGMAKRPTQPDGGIDAGTVENRTEKRAFIDQLDGHSCCAAVDNGYDDIETFKAQALPAAAIGAQRASPAANAAHMLCSWTSDALDLLIADTGLDAPAVR